ncbi:MAG: methyltransferase domain-containing protein [Nitrospirae bacterium]|nr:methyltransferase domain-containing protein [Nitrospirota bacterium]
MWGEEYRSASPTPESLSPVPFSVQSGLAVPLSSVKPLDRLGGYRSFCIDTVRNALRVSGTPRTSCPACHLDLAPIGVVEQLPYAGCGRCRGFFLQEIPNADRWAEVLRSTAEGRRRNLEFSPGLAASRQDKVYLPKIEWIRNSLRLHGMGRTHALDVGIPPGDMAPLLRGSRLFSEVSTVDEARLTETAVGSEVRELEEGTRRRTVARAGVAVLLEALDRARDPARLLRGVRERLVEGGLLFLTAAVSSGFDMTVLGLRNKYLYPPDRTNCFGLAGLEQLLRATGFELIEVSTPGALDIETVRVHAQEDGAIPLSPFERRLLESGSEVQEAFQSFLQEMRMSSFARVVGRKSDGRKGSEA